VGESLEQLTDFSCMCDALKQFESSDNTIYSVTHQLDFSCMCDGLKQYQRKQYELKLVVYDPVEEVIVKWIK